MPTLKRVVLFLLTNTQKQDLEGAVVTVAPPIKANFGNADLT